jgi:hypothetical protein
MTPSANKPIPHTARFISYTVVNVTIDNSRKADKSHPDDRKRRVCRAGCGVEKTAGQFDTPGFASRDAPELVKDERGFTRFEMTREVPPRRLNVIQTSLTLAHGWRANCDLKLLLFEGDPYNPDPAEIAKVTNYIVSYASKGVETWEVEKEQIKSLILSTDEYTGCIKDVVTVARKILNHYVGQKLISKQECMVQLGGMELFECSEIIDQISLSGYSKLTEKGLEATTDKYLKEYAFRKPEVSAMTRGVS